MKNNLLGKVAMKIANLGKSRLDFSHDVSTSAAFGDVQPVTCKLIMPKSNGTIDSKNLVRFATMLAPTFGRIKAKLYHTLVPYSDLMQNLPFMMAQGKRWNNQGSSVIAPTDLPNMTLGLLSRYILIGAEVEVYQHEDTDAAVTTSIKYGNTVAACQSIENDAMVSSRIGDWFNFNRTDTGAFVGYVGPMMNLGAITSPWSIAENIHSSAFTLWIPIKNKDADSLFGVRNPVVSVQGVTSPFVEHIPIEKGSYCLTTQVNDRTYTFVFRLSSFGKRLRKQIIGSGKQIDFTSTDKVQVVDLMAIWKAWFDLFGLTLFENYELTPLYRLCQSLDNTTNVNLDTSVGSTHWLNFIVALGLMYYTDAQDIVSAHVSSTAISPSLGLSANFVDVSNNNNVTEIGNIDGSQTNGHAFINSIQHGALDSEYLMKLYHWTNRNTIVGKAIEKVLRAQGLGDFVDSCKSNFIGYHEELMQINDVVSQADTWDENTKTGSMLGEYGGRGLSVYKTTRHSFSTNEYAFQVSLLTIVPDAGYLQAIDPTAYCIKKTDLFLPDFDGMGMEATRKTIVCGARNWCSQVPYSPEGSMSENFGFVPQGTHLKLAHDINNGDFTLRDTRDGYLRYTMDKFIDVGERMKVYDVNGGTETHVKFSRALMASEIATASLHYRFPCRYPWMGNYNRIFAYQGDVPQDDFYRDMAEDQGRSMTKWEFLHNDYDNFLIHMIVSEPVWSPCKAIEQSFETFVEGEKPNASMEKA